MGYNLHNLIANFGLSALSSTASIQFDGRIGRKLMIILAINCKL